MNLNLKFINKSNKSNKKLAYSFVPSLLIFLTLLIANAIFEPNSLSFFGLTGLISTYLALILISIGQTYVVFTGNIDLSSGAILSVVNVTVVTLITYLGDSSLSILAVMILGVTVGLLCGLINGIVVCIFRLQSIVATFATSIFYSGLALYIMPVSGEPIPDIYWLTYADSFFGIPFVLIVLLFILMVVYLISNTLLNTMLQAVGDNIISAYQSGLKTNGIRLRAYALSGIFSALGALCILGDTANGDPLVGNKMTLLSVAAVVLGGSLLSGGKGTVLGSIFGALSIALINSLVFFIGTPSEWQNLVQGLAILFALVLGILITRSVK